MSNVRDKVFYSVYKLRSNVEISYFLSVNFNQPHSHNWKLRPELEVIDNIKRDVEKIHE